MLHQTPILLAAGWKDVLGALVPLVFLLLWVISQFAEAKKGGNPAGRKPAAGQPPKPAPGPGGRAAVGPMRDQVGEFLRRAGRPPQPGQGRPVGDPLDPLASRQPSGPSARPPEGIEVLLDDKPPATERSPLAKPLRPLDERVGQAAEPSPLAATPRRLPRRPIAAKPRRESVAEHVAEHVDAATRELAEHSARLGDRVIQADQQFDDQVKAKFDHQLGTLGSQRDAGPPERPTAPASDAPARQIAAMLADPAGVRQAIVLSEILNRPSDRWE
jgi:hypothetical protein